MDVKSWKALPATLLSDAGKEIVMADPDLSRNTINALLELDNIDPATASRKFYFREKDGSDIGCITLSICIEDDIFAVFADLVAKYAFMRCAPFSLTADALYKLRHTDGLYYYKETTLGGEPQRVPWTPRSVTLRLPPTKKGTKERN